MHARHLPAEIWHMVIKDHLDVNADRSTFLVLLRVSSSLWYETASILYRNLDISGDKMRRLLLNGARNPPTAPPTPPRLNLRNMDKSHAKVILAAAIPNVVLFPGVIKLHVYSTITRLLWAQLFVRCDQSIALFGAIHLCAWGAQASIIASKLAAKKYHTLNQHGWSMHLMWSETFSPLHEPFDKSSSVHCFVDKVESHTVLPEYTLSSLLYVPPARYLVGSARNSASTPHIPVGNWDKNETSQHQFRMDLSQHAPCVVCGGKMKLDDRVFERTFTTSW
ncbi:hypothetical protein Q8F55_000577 [Vanrija albida]|uniref:F-box domain-containing protein n=1 Tax=Vanrija albida TaxID=181172 RepID=A0ABR3QDQ5_9TREE